ncbi:hypothetical protein FALBO_11921 [Fusarium albosuccineum]|uniref:Uncharacterized protein n=1 Tax=Fusarium albosuccineum TaxID=1237068 RepID=A0A8H4L4Z2_9HYPO|nr:hypothetical protein FALBO_11921 [Fusarium albosuccineum]
MSAPTASYAQSQAYREYTSLTQRPDDLMPGLQTNENGGIRIAAGERYCRHLIDGVNLCPKSHIFVSTSALRHHYRTFHHVRLEPRRQGRLSALQEYGVTLWYRDLMAGRKPIWNPSEYQGPSDQVDEVVGDHSHPPSPGEGNSPNAPTESRAVEDDSNDVRSTFSTIPDPRNGAENVDPRSQGCEATENNADVRIESVVTSTSITARRAADRAQTQRIAPQAGNMSSSRGQKRSWDQMTQDEVDAQLEIECTEPSTGLPMNPPILPSGELDLDGMRALSGMPAGQRCDHCIRGGKCMHSLLPPFVEDTNDIVCPSLIEYDSQCSVWKNFVNPIDPSNS